MGSKGWVAGIGAIKLHKGLHFNVCWLSRGLIGLLGSLTGSVACVQVPSPLTDEEGDFILIHHEDLQLSQKADEVYAQLQKMLLEQHEVSTLPLLPLRGLHLLSLSFSCPPKLCASLERGSSSVNSKQNRRGAQW